MSIPERFAYIVARYPEKLAVQDHEVSLTYADLGERVAGTVSVIQRSIGHPDRPASIGLIFEPTVESAVAMLSVLCSGNVFVPLSPADPPSRIAEQLDDADVDLVLTTREALSDRIRGALELRPFVLVENVTGKEDADRREPVTIAPDRLAAILYTSGSTGRPKGVMHTHHSLLEMVRDRGNGFGISPSDRIGGLSTFSFGIYYWNVLGAALYGAALHLYDFYRLPFEGLARWLRERRVSCFHCTPTTLRQFLHTLDEPADLPDLRLISLGGESIHPEDAYRIQERFEVAPAICVTGGTIEAWFFAAAYLKSPFPEGIDRLPMGFVNEASDIRIVDHHGAPLPAGETGEIIVTGPAISPGYWKRTDLDDEKYGKKIDGRRFFCTGDLGLLTADGLVYHAGRKDFQVKIRGIRVEPGETEAALHRHPSVKEAVVVGRPGHSGVIELVAYVVVRDKETVRSSDIIHFLSGQLPPHQIPTRLIQLDAFPLTRTHKIDRHALPDPDEFESEPRGMDPEKPKDEVERRLHAIWAEVLRRADFGVTDTLLELGGDSLAAISIRGRIEKEYQIAIPFVELLTDASIERLARRIRGA